jgi:hypothetical protein
MQTNRTESIVWRMGSLAGFAAAVGLALLWTGGCSPQSMASSAVGAAAASAVSEAANAPSTSIKSQAAASTHSIVGRWVIQKQVAYADGTPAPDAVSTLVFNKDGSYETSSHAGYGPLVAFRGTYQAFGTSLTTHLGKASSNFTYRIQGSDLILVDKATKQAKTYHRG